MLHGIRLFGSKGNIYSVCLAIENWRTDDMLLDIDGGTFSSVPFPCKAQEIDVFDVMFDPLTLQKNKYYVVKAWIFGTNSCFGGAGGMFVKCHGVTFHFRNHYDYFCYEPEEMATSVASGQFAELFFKPL